MLIDTKKFFLLLTVCISIVVPASASSVTYLYASDVYYIDAPDFLKIDLSTGRVADAYGPLLPTGADGIAVVGGMMYYTVAGDSNVYKYDTTSHLDEGLVFNTGLPAVGVHSLAFDGTDFWVSGGYSNNAYLYSPTGVLLKTVTLTSCTGGCVGLEYFVSHGHGFLIASEDVCYSSPCIYDIYDTNGNLVRSHFITATNAGQWGIAWDGKNFWTADSFAQSISEWDANGGFVQTIPVTGGGPAYLWDMSFDYRQTLTTPEPPAIVLLVSGLVAALVVLQGIGRCRALHC